MSSSKRAHRRRVAAEERQIQRVFTRTVRKFGFDVPPLPARKDRFGPVRVFGTVMKYRRESQRDLSA